MKVDGHAPATFDSQKREHEACSRASKPVFFFFLLSCIASGQISCLMLRLEVGAFCFFRFYVTNPFENLNVLASERVFLYIIGVTCVKPKKKILFRVHYCSDLFKYCITFDSAVAKINQGQTFLFCIPSRVTILPGYMIQFKPKNSIH